MSEATSAEPQPPFHEIDVPLTELNIGTNNEVRRRIFRQLSRRGLSLLKMVYAGIDGEPIKQQKTFGDDRRIRGFTAQEFIDGSREADKPGYTIRDHPLSDAQVTSHTLPALAVFDVKSLINLEDPEQTQRILMGNEPPQESEIPYDKQDWEVRSGLTMDQAAQAIIYFTF